VSRIELYCCSRIPPQHTFTHYQSSIKTLLSFNLRDSFVKRQISQHLDKWWHVYSRQKRPLSVQTRPISVFTHMLTHLSRCSIVPFHTWWHVNSLQKRSLSVQKRPISVFTHLSRWLIVTLFAKILCPSALSLSGPLLIAYSLLFTNHLHYYMYGRFTYRVVPGYRNWQIESAGWN